MKKLLLTLLTLLLVNISAMSQLNQRPNGDHYLTPDSYGNPIPLDVYHIDEYGNLSFINYHSTVRMDAYMSGLYFFDIAQPCYSDTLLTIVGVSGFFMCRYYNSMNGYIHIADTNFNIHRTLNIPKEEPHEFHNIEDVDTNYTEMFFEQPINVKGKFLVIWDNPKPDVVNAQYDYDYSFSTRDTSYASLLAYITDTSITHDYLPYVRYCYNDTLFSWRKWDDSVPLVTRIIYNPSAIFYLFPIFSELDTTLECIGCEIDSVNASLQSSDIVKMYSHIFPNPVKNELHVQCSFKIKEIEVYNTLSQCVLTEKVNKYHTLINTSQLEKGSYILRIKTKSGYTNKKFIVK